ncbi:MAG: ABC transporter ATP-binding protein [Pirellula sp.]|jgi:ABC-2 type transport system ATP-binding protein
MITLNHTTLLYGTVIGINDFQIDLPVGAYALVGPNGAGKSTLIGLLTGAIKPTLGSVSVFGVDPFRDPSVLQRIGLCPASELLIHGVTSRQWLRLQLALSGWDSRKAIARADMILELVGLKDAVDRPIHTYSLGMRQRCKLAQALANDPDLLILDEPFNGLDPIGRHQMTELLKQWAESGKSLLLASHVLHEVERITNSFMLVYGGRLLAFGTAGELRTLLAGIPQEITIRTRSLDELASRLSRMPWLRSLQRDNAQNQLHVAVETPLDLYQQLVRWTAEDGLIIEQITGIDGDISSLFRLLVSKHRGEVMMTGVMS